MKAETQDAPVFLDFNATTPLDPRVFEAMRECFLGDPANSGSRTHVYGQRAKDIVDSARAKVASVINAEPEEIVFTSGATESNNLAILGLAPFGENAGRKHVISTAIEHKAVLEPLEILTRRGFDVELVPVGAGGYVDPDEVLRRCRSDTLLVSVMHANNETGVMQPVKELGEALRAREVFFHVDAAQTFGKEEEISLIDCDLMSISGHKIYGPQGVGALFASRSGDRPLPISPLVFGGGQERKFRPGTVPVPLVVGLGEASRIAAAEMQVHAQAALKVKEKLLEDLKTVDHVINGDLNRTQSHVVNVRFPGVDSEALMMALREYLAISNGSACTSDSYQPSHVLLAMGLDHDEAQEAVRISWGRGVHEVPTSQLLHVVDDLKLEF